MVGGGGRGRGARAGARTELVVYGALAATRSSRLLGHICSGIHSMKLDVGARRLTKGARCQAQPPEDPETWTPLVAIVADSRNLDLSRQSTLDESLV